jgi:hypothetical protein
LRDDRPVLALIDQRQREQERRDGADEQARRPARPAARPRRRNRGRSGRGRLQQRPGPLAQRTPDPLLALQQPGPVGQLAQPRLGLGAPPPAQRAVGEPDEQDPITI